MKKIITGVIVAAMFSTAARANEGNLVHIDSTPICNFVVTNQSVPNGGEVRLRAVQDGSPIGFISIGQYSESIKAIRGGKVIPVQKITSNEVFKVPVSEGGKYAIFLTKDGQTCAKDVSITKMDGFDRISLAGYSVDIKVYVPEF